MALLSEFSSAPRATGTPTVIVIGAGVGGLVAALLLATKGVAVTLVDRAAGPGGKLRQVMVGDAAIDCGPTVLTLCDTFESIFAEAGTTMAAHLSVTPADVLARHAWTAGAHLDLFADVERSAEAIGDFAGAAEAKGYRAFCRHAADVYRLLNDPFIRTDRPDMLRLMRALGFGRDALRIAPFSTLWRSLGGYFKDPRLRQLFGRYATYCGSSPYACPATLMLVAHVERSGVWLVEGGMHRIATALADLAKAKGAVIHYGAEASGIHIDRGRVAGVDLANGERLEADAVVCNADVAALAAGLLGDEVRAAVASRKPSARSLSAVTFALNAATGGLPLLRHNVFFSRDYRAEFDDVFGRHRLPRSPTVYVCAQDRGGGDGHAPLGSERLFLIVNAPPNGDTHAFDTAEIARCAARTWQTLARCGLTVGEPRQRQITTPADFERLFPATGGALYGAASHGWTASFRRPGVRSKIPGLYLCGGSVHPGPGLPMAALSGRMAAWCLMEDLASRRTSRPAVMPGGTSMR